MKEASKVKQTDKAKHHSTPKAVTFPKKNELPRVGLEPTTLYTLDRAPRQLMYIVPIHTHVIGLKYSIQPNSTLQFTALYGTLYLPMHVLLCYNIPCYILYYVYLFHSSTQRFIALCGDVYIRTYADAIVVVVFIPC